MRRFIVLPAALLLLSSCAVKSDIPPEEVLRESSQANQAIRSAAFDFDILLNIPSTEGVSVIDAAVTGVMMNGGQQLQFELESEGATAAGTDWHAIAQFVIAGAHETYVKLEELTLNPAPSTLPSEKQAELMGRWWLLPFEGTTGATNVTPDPRILQMQTEVIDVTRDYGITTRNDHRVHHYDVVVNNDKLASFLSSINAGTGSTVDAAAIEAQLQSIMLTGEIWIDADTYVLRRAEWSAKSPVPGGDPLMSMAIDIYDHNNDMTVSPPAEFEPFPIESSLQALPILTP